MRGDYTHTTLSEIQDSIAGINYVDEVPALSMQRARAAGYHNLVDSCSGADPLRLLQEQGLAVAITLSKK